MSLFARLIVVLFAAVGIASAQRPYFSEPSLSPDRKEIAFVSGGDIWTVPSTGGVASLLVSHAATESRPMYSPDGKQLAFISTRTGNALIQGKRWAKIAAPCIDFLMMQNGHCLANATLPH